MSTGLTILLDIQDVTDMAPTLFMHIFRTYKIPGVILPEALRNAFLPQRITEPEVFFVLRAAKYL